VYLDQVSIFQFSEATEMPRYLVVFADNVGDAIKFEILKNHMVTGCH
jgi:hypothetical protein